MSKDEQDMGREIKENNEQIVHCLFELKSQRDDIIFLIQKQKEERKKLETEMERLTYKLCLINKSMAQRVKAKNNYDQTIEEIEEKYNKLKENSEDLRSSVAKNCHNLDSMINKKTSTEREITTKEIGTEDLSSEELLKSIHNASSEESDENEKGEKMVSKQTQAAEAEVPTKLEKEAKEEVEPAGKNQEKGAQTVVSGEPEHSSDEDEDEDDYGEETYDAQDKKLNLQKQNLDRAVSEYKDSIRTKK